MTIYRWRCSRCAITYAPAEVRYTCPRCGHAGLLDMELDYEQLRTRWGPVQLGADHRRSIWRYRPLLPLSDPDHHPTVDKLTTLGSVGWTPLYQAERLGRGLGLSQLFIKDDARNPTGSYKDRASAVVIAKAMELGEPIVATASSGNAAAALAGMGAASGVSTIIFVPDSAPEGKIAQLLVHGATVFLVQGSYDAAFDLCRDACDRWGWYCRNTGYNPHTTEGKKTGALEIVEQLGWEAPDTVIVSVGDGNIITGLHRGFQDALALGWIQRMPRLIGVQSVRSPAVFHAWESGALDVSSDRAESLADSINVSLPRDGFRALRAMRATTGQCIAVEDDAILNALGRVARLAGVFAEPAGATAFAGLFALIERGEIAPNERVVVVNTGAGLKDVKAAVRATGRPTRITPDLAAVEAGLAGLDASRLV